MIRPVAALLYKRRATRGRQTFLRYVTELTIRFPPISDHIVVTKASNSEFMTEDERRQLHQLIRRRNSSARERARARVVDLLDRGEKPAQVAAKLKVGLATSAGSNRYVTSRGRAALR